MKPAALEELEAATEVIYQHLQPTPQIAWPLLAELLQEREQMAGKRVGLILSGGNVGSDVYSRVLNN